jgi:hypothetical protein
MCAAVAIRFARESRIVYLGETVKRDAWGTFPLFPEIWSFLITCQRGPADQPHASGSIDDPVSVIERDRSEAMDRLIHTAEEIFRMMSS